MNFSHLKYIVEVENTGSITKAAANLFMGQPNLSKAIKELESEIASQPRKVFPEKLPVAVATGGDTHVFRLYALTPAEIALIKSSTAR